MGCNSKIDSFFSKAKKLKAGLSYGVYKELQFGNTEKAEKYEKSLQDIKSMSWLLKKHEYSVCDCDKHKCLCSGAAYDVEEESLFDGDIQVGNPGVFAELYKGVVYSSKLGKNVSLTTFQNANLSSPDNHTGIRLYSWEGSVSTLVYEENNIIDIALNSDVSFYYSELHNSYYIKTGNQPVNDVSPVTIFKVAGNFVSPAITSSSFFPAFEANPSGAVMEVADSRGALYVKANEVVLYELSLIDLSEIDIIVDVTMLPYQKMTWDECNCNLYFTGDGDVSTGAVIQMLDTSTGTFTTLLDDPTLRNNTSTILANGDLLVLTTPVAPAGVNNTIMFQRWSTCDVPLLKETFDTGRRMGVNDQSFQGLYSLAEDSNGNIYVTTMSPVDAETNGITALTVFDKDFNHLYTKDLVGFGSGVIPSWLMSGWTNNIINKSTGSLIIHSRHNNGIGGTYNYYLDYKKLERIKPKCIELTSEEINSLVNKLNYIEVPKAYKSLGLNTNIKNIKDCNRLFVYQQETASVLWTINHNLNTFPVIIAVDNLGNKLTGLETYVSKNTVTILFSIPVAGTAYLTYNIQ